MIGAGVRATARVLAGLAVAAAAASPTCLRAQERAQIAVPLGQAGLVLHSAPAIPGSPAATPLSAPWSGLSAPPWAGAPLTYFTPRSGGLRLGPGAVGLVGPAAGPRRSGTNHLSTGESGDGLGAALALPLSGFGLGGPGAMELSLATGFATAPAGRGTGEEAGWAVSESVGLAGRIGIAGFSVGGVLAETGERGVMLGPPSRKGGAGYDLSYAFGFGAVSLFRFDGTGDALFGVSTESPHETLAVSGRYVIARHLDMMALLAHRTAKDDAEDAADGSGWTLVTGMRLSF